MTKPQQLLRILVFFFSLCSYSDSKAQELHWVRSMGDVATEKGYHLTSDDSGNVYIFGLFSGTVDFDPGGGVFNLTAIAGGKSFFIQKLDSIGNFKWAVSFGTSSLDNMPGSIKLDKLHNIYATGKHIGNMDADPGPGTTTLGSSVVGTSFTIKLNNSGEFIWAKVIAGQTGNDGTASAVDDSCNVYIVGDFFGNVDFDPGAGSFIMSAINTWNVFYLKLDSAGNFMWAKSIGALTIDRCYDVEVDNLGNFYTCGRYGDMVDLDPGPGTHNLSGGNINVFVGKYDRNGNFLNGTGTGGFLGDAFSSALTFDKQKNIYVTGRFHGIVDFNTDAGLLNFNAGTTYDNFIVKLDSACNFQWAKHLKSTASNAYSYGIDVDTSGNVYTVGSFSDSLGIVLTDTTTEFLVAGETEINGYIIKRNGNGEMLWAYPLSGPDSNAIIDINVNQQNKIYTTGYFSGTVDFDFMSAVENRTSTGAGDYFVQKLSPDTTVVVSILQKMKGDKTVILYPNPTAGTTHIIAEYDIDKVVVTDMLGKKVYETVPQKTTTSFTLSTPGIYFITIRSGNEISTQKLVVN